MCLCTVRCLVRHSFISLVILVSFDCVCGHVHKERDQEKVRTKRRDKENEGARKRERASERERTRMSEHERAKQKEATRGKERENEGME